MAGMENVRDPPTYPSMEEAAGTMSRCQLFRKTGTQGFQNPGRALSWGVWVDVLAGRFLGESSISAGTNKSKHWTHPQSKHNNVVRRLHPSGFTLYDRACVALPHSQEE